MAPFSEFDAGFHAANNRSNSLEWCGNTPESRGQRSAAVQGCYCTSYRRGERWQSVCELPSIIPSRSGSLLGITGPLRCRFHSHSGQKQICLSQVSALYSADGGSHPAGSSSKSSSGRTFSRGPGPRAHTVPGDGLVSHIIPSLVFVQIDWPAPQDKKKECAAKGKNNQVRHRAERLTLRSADAPLC